MKANRCARSLARDDAAAFPVVEAILVAVLVLSAILFFTSVQRPTTGAEEGGLDLGQTARDTLLILQGRSFPDQTSNGLEAWVTNAMQGDTATLTDLEEFLEDVLPAGARYQLRLGNGVSYLTIAPAGGSEAPRGARAAEMTLLPGWTALHGKPPAVIVHPGQTGLSGRALELVDGTCTGHQGPAGSANLLDQGDPGTALDTWAAHWQAAPGPAAPWKQLQAQIPLDAPYGTWSAVCGASTTYFAVARPGDAGFRLATGSVVTKASATDELVAAAGTFSGADIGKPVLALDSAGTGSLLPPGTRIGGWDGAAGSVVTVSPDASNVASTTPATFIIGDYSPYLPYALQLVVWFGA